VFSLKKLIISPRIQSCRGITLYPAILLLLYDILTCCRYCRHCVLYWCYDEFKNFASKCVSSHPHHCSFGSSFLVCLFVFLFFKLLCNGVFFLHFSIQNCRPTYNIIIIRYNNIITAHTLTWVRKRRSERRRPSGHWSRHCPLCPPRSLWPRSRGRRPATSKRRPPNASTARPQNWSSPQMTRSSQSSTTIIRNLVSTYLCVPIYSKYLGTTYKISRQIIALGGRSNNNKKKKFTPIP